MSIWYTDLTPEELNASGKNTMGDFLDIEITEVGQDFLKATMPVTSKNVQPMRLLHGGASVVLAETLGSVASWIIHDPNTINGAVGVEVNANHLKSAKEGEIVTGVVKPIKVGRNIHVWDIKIYNSSDELCCVSRLTTMILHKKS